MSGSRANDMLLNLMAFTSAPLSSASILQDGLGSIGPEDMNAETLLDELDMFSELMSGGLEAYKTAFKAFSEMSAGNSSEDDAVDNEGVLLPPATVPPQAHANLSLYLLPFFFRRMHRLSEMIIKVADTCRKTYYGGDVTPQMTEELRRIIGMVNNNARPRLQTEYLDMTRNVPWEMPDLKNSPPSSNKNISWRPTAQEVSNVGVVEAPVKATSAFGGRRKQRNPTGFIKFNPRELDLNLDDDDDEDDKTSASGPPAGNDDDKLYRQHSSFDRSPKFIDDKNADPEWNDEKRAASREARVRKRIPTGHPSMMKTALLARQSLELDEDTDEETRYNTGTNERIG